MCTLQHLLVLNVFARNFYLCSEKLETVRLGIDSRVLHYISAISLLQTEERWRIISSLHMKSGSLPLELAISTLVLSAFLYMMAFSKV